jgi:putative DNA primase/helicase
MSHHLDALRARGLTDATIKAAGIFSTADRIKLASILDRKSCPFKSAALVIPYTDMDGGNGYARVRPDVPRVSAKKPVKYESPAEQRNQIYIPPGVADVLSDSARGLVVTEGEFKALAASQHGYPCIGLVGIFGWAMKNHESLLPEMERIAWRPRRVFVAFDSDIADKPDVQDAEARLSAQLTNRGAIVRVVRIPAGPAGEKQGLDDYLAVQPDPIAALQGLLNAAEEPVSPRSVKTKKPGSDIDSCHEGPAFVESNKLDGRPCLIFWRDGWHYYHRGAYREHQLAEVRTRLVEFLMQNYFRIAQSHTSNVLEIAKAKTIVPFSVEPPAWIGGKVGPWPADEVLVARNGIYHLPSLATGAEPYLIPLTPRLFVQNALDFDIDPKAPLPDLWFGFLSELWGEDIDAISTLQEWFGYCLTADTSQQKILLIIGPPRSGKGTISRVLRALIGANNVCGPTLGSLCDRFGLAPLLGKSLAVVNDARLSGRADTAVVVERLLSISGEDALSIDRKHTDAVTCKLPTRIMLITNELPRLGDASGALASRVLLLRLQRSFSGHEDHGLTDKLIGELPGILRWSAEGWQQLRGRGRFQQAESGESLLADLCDLSSPVAEFVRERCIVDPAARVVISDLYADYKQWATSKGRQHIEDDRGFGRVLRAAVPTIDRKQYRVEGERDAFYTGIGLRCL